MEKGQLKYKNTKPQRNSVPGVCHRTARTQQRPPAYVLDPASFILNLSRALMLFSIQSSANCKMRQRSV